MATILIVSSNIRYSEQCQALLAAEHNTYLEGSIEAAKQFVQQQSVMLMIIDGELVHSDIELLQIKSLGLKILIFGCNWTEDRQIKILVAGIAGYCDNNSVGATLLSAANSILQGDIWVQRHLVPRVIERLIQLNNISKPTDDSVIAIPQARLKSLTHRELDVAKMIRRGENNKVIAAELNISERTVKAHLTSIFQKLKVHDRLRLGLLLKEIN